MNLNTIASDIRTYGAVAIGVLLVLANAFPSFGLSNGWQAVITAIIGVLTALAQINKTSAVKTAAAKAAAK